MGGKSSPTPPPAVEPQAGLDMTAMMGMFQQMMAGMPQMAPPEIPDAPPVEADPVIDWTEQQAELAKQVRSDYEDETSRKRGRADTILTSPLLDEELGKDASLLTE